MSFPHIAMAHDPIFGMGPHVIYEGGLEISSSLDIANSGSAYDASMALLNTSYGVTSNLTLGSELLWLVQSNSTGKQYGLGDWGILSKYRFWHKDSLGTVDSMAALLKVKFNTSQGMGTGSTDEMIGVSYGHESLTWYRWASVRYRHNGVRGIKKIGDKLLTDLVVGWRPKMPEYLKPDLVWLLELNDEYSQYTRSQGMPVINSGGTELFLSPGFMWTLRNMAFRGGVQLPVFSQLHGSQVKTSYRLRLQLDWHL